MTESLIASEIVPSGEKSLVINLLWEFLLQINDLVDNFTAAVNYMKLAL